MQEVRDEGHPDLGKRREKKSILPGSSATSPKIDLLPLAGLNPLEAILIKHFYGRAAQGDGAPRRLVQFGLRDAQVARLAIMSLKTRMAAAGHDQAEKNEFLGLFIERAGRLHGAQERAKGFLRFGGGTGRGFKCVRAANVVRGGGIFRWCFHGVHFLWLDG